jgi:hypothetical protein
MKSRFIASLCAALALTVACGGKTKQNQPPPVGYVVQFDPTLAKIGDAAQTWLAYPFPADHRRQANGNVQFDDFPLPDGVQLLPQYLQVGESEVDGFSTQGAVHMAFNGPLDITTIPTDPSQFIATNAPIQLIDITEASPEYRIRWPIRWEFRDKTLAGAYVTPNSLAAAPYWGFPLREKRTYALIVTTAVKGTDGNPLQQPPLLGALLDNDSTAPDVTPSVPADLYSQLLTEFAPLRAVLTTEHTPTTEIAAATVFTTQSITSQLTAIYQQVNAAAAPAYEDGSWQVPTPEGGMAPNLWVQLSFQWSSTASVNYWVMEGRYSSPNYEVGQVPYSTTGAQFNFVNGVPQPDHYEELRFVLTIPTTAPANGAQCYPIVMVAHGTGGDAYTFVDDGTAGRMAARGLAGIGIDQPLAGLRADGQCFQVDVLSFNYNNADSLRTLFRQSAVDSFVLARFATESLQVPANRSPTGTAICFDPTKLSAFGHSQGGITMSFAAAFERRPLGWMLSGTGGGFTQSLLIEKQIAQVTALLPALLVLRPTETLTELHPAMTMVQTLSDIADPDNYSPLWIDQTSAKPQNVMSTSAFDDPDTPHLGAIAEAVAARYPAVQPVCESIPQYEWLQMPYVNAPVSGNVKRHTAGFLTWPSGGHFIVYNVPDLINASMVFLQTSVTDPLPQIVQDPTADVR